MDTDRPNIHLIDGGRVKQVVVEYLGPKKGSIAYRGASSGRSYPFSALPSMKRRYVLYKDAERFRKLALFRVLEETMIDPDLERQKVGEERLLNTVARFLDQRLTKPRRRGTGRPSGRPRLPVDDLLLMWHLRRHCEPRWAPAELAAEFRVDSVNPANAVSQRLTRFKREHPELIGMSDCPHCSAGHYPEPPASC